MRNEAEYMRDYRKRNPESLKKQKRREIARRTALRLLSERHPEEYKQILALVERHMVLKGETDSEQQPGSQDRIRQRDGQGDGAGPAIGPA